MSEEQAPAGTVVEAVGAMATSLSRHGSLAKRIEKAMSDAIRDAYAQGITDPVKVRERMMQARQAVKDEDLKAQQVQHADAASRA